MNNFKLVLPPEKALWDAIRFQIPMSEYGQWPNIRFEAYEEYYSQLTKAQCEHIGPYLPPNCHIIELGCGVGRLSVGLYKMGYCDKITLVDYDELQRKYLANHWQNGNTYPNNTLEATQIFVEANGVTNWEFQDLNKVELKDLPEADVVLSVFSVGHHYPIDMASLYNKANLFLFGIPSEGAAYDTDSFPKFDFRNKTIIKSNSSFTSSRRVKFPFLCLQK